MKSKSSWTRPSPGSRTRLRRLPLVWKREQPRHECCCEQSPQRAATNRQELKQRKASLSWPNREALSIKASLIVCEQKATKPPNKPIKKLVISSDPALSERRKTQASTIATIARTAPVIASLQVFPQTMALTSRFIARQAFGKVLFARARSV